MLGESFEGTGNAMAKRLDGVRIENPTSLQYGSSAVAVVYSGSK